jgi:hypothetical protein
VVYIEMVMTPIEANGLSMYLALKDYYPLVMPSMEFVSNLFDAFDEEVDSGQFELNPWTTDLETWLPTNVGLIRDPTDVDWNKFRIVDEKLYTIALLKYS